MPFDDALILGGDDELGSALVAGGVAVSWRRPRSSSDTGSLVVVTEDCSLTISDVARHLAPGGTLYMEVDRRRRGQRTRSTGRVERMLRKRGHQLFSIHIAAPDFDHPRRYLPIDHRGALRWYLRVLVIAATPVARAGSSVLSALLSTPVGEPLLRLSVPRYTMIATRAHDDSSAVGIPMARGGERAIVVTSGYDKASRAVVLPFAPGAHAPRFAVKIASSPATAVGTVREHERLIALHAALPEDIARGIPEPMGTFTLAGRTACVQSCAPGPLMNATVGQWRRPLGETYRDLEAVVDWLSEFALATAVDRDTARQDWMSIFRDAGGVVDLPAGVIELLAEAECVAAGTRLGGLAVHQHYDAAPWNVHLDGTKAVLIDWETDDLRPADCLGPPLADVAYLVSYWYFLVSGARSDEQEEAALLRVFATPAATDPAVVAARSAIDRAARRVGVERCAVPAAVVAMWAERMVYTHRRRAALGKPIGAGRSRPEAYLRALAASSSPLFATWQDG
ncbi:MAG TPA: aminoglycoside phosphotransferase family protein [Ilumatobacteraceae bacterium]|nr:aminoglycoside phosphotransferase family protein [Ilumatobacteraceae bacterium]